MFKPVEYLIYFVVLTAKLAFIEIYLFRDPNLLWTLPDIRESVSV